MNHIVRRWRLSPILILLTCVLTACGGAASSEYASVDTTATTTTIEANGALDACALITPEQAAAALGQTAKAAQRGPVEHEGDASSASVSTCSYDAADTSSLASMGLLVRRAPGDENTAGAIDAVRATVRLDAHDIQDVPHVGDTAFWGNHQLHVFSGERVYVIVSMFGMPDDAAALGRAEQVAKLALDKL